VKSVLKKPLVVEPQAVDRTFETISVLQRKVWSLDHKHGRKYQSEPARTYFEWVKQTGRNTFLGID